MHKFDLPQSSAGPHTAQCSRARLEHHAAGAVLLRRSTHPESAIYVDSGWVVLGILDAEARCAEGLLRHAETGTDGACSVRLQQCKRMFAAQRGIAPETLSRVLRHLRERSLISGTGRLVQLVDVPGLQTLSGS